MAFKKHHDVRIYTSEGSVMCDLTKAYFRDAGLDFDEFNISNNDENRKIMLEATGDEGQTPVVDFDGRIIVGYQPDVYGILIKEGDTEKEK